MGTGYLKQISYRATLDYLVVAFCRDFASRRQAIEDGECGKRTRMEYEYVNGRLEDAAREIVGRDFEIYINEIGEGIGYARSEVDGISEGEYKKRKREVKINIARKLHLLD